MHFPTYRQDVTVYFEKNLHYNFYYSKHNETMDYSLLFYLCYDICLFRFFEIPSATSLMLYPPIILKVTKNLSSVSKMSSVHFRYERFLWSISIYLFRVIIYVMSSYSCILFFCPLQKNVYFHFSSHVKRFSSSVRKINDLYSFWKFCQLWYLLYDK